LEQITSFKFAGDWFFYLNAIAQGDIAFVNRKLNYHRRHSTSTMSLLCTDHSLYFGEIERVHQYVLEKFVLTAETTKKMKRYILDEAKSRGIVEDVAKYYTLPILDGTACYKKQLNIAIVFSGYYFGGAEIFPINMANSFAELGHNTYLVNSKALETDIRVENMVSPLVNKERPEGDDSTKWFKEFIFNNKIDYINSQGWFGTDFVQKNIDEKILTDVPWFASMHGHEENIISGSWGEEYSSYFETAFKRTLELKPTFINTHEKNLEVFDFYNTHEYHNVCLPTLGMPNALPSKALKSELGIPKDSFVIGMIARGIPEKGWEEAILSVIELRGIYNKKVDLVLIGDSDYVQKLKSKFSKYGYIHFLGLSDKVLEWGQIFDVSLLPSFYKSESHPLVIMGYLLCKSPVITTPLGNIPEMISSDSGQAGHLVSLEDNGKPSSSIIAKLINEYIEEPSVYDQQSNNAERAFVKFDITNATNDYIEVFKGRQ